jgi:hypothetical protein
MRQSFVNEVDCSPVNSDAIIASVVVNMKHFVVIILLVTVLAPGVSNAQRVSVPRKIAAAERAWKVFFPRFRTAVRRRDRVALRQMMIPEFLYSFGGNLDRDEALEAWDRSDSRAWQAFARVLAKGAISSRRAMQRIPENPVLSRIAPPAARKRGYTAWRATFEYGEDGQWRCIAFVQGD